MTDRWRTSGDLLERARHSLAGGVSSPFRAHFPIPLYFRDGSGSRLVDVDGNQYIDYTLAWGPALLGHKHPKIVEAISRQAWYPHIYGAQHELEPVVAEMIQSLAPCAQRVAFTSSGSEAVQLALRLARAHTGRNLIIKFEGHYHGWMDSVLISHHPASDEIGPRHAPHAAPESRGQVANAADNVVVLPWNDLDLLGRAFHDHADRIAAVIMEPVLCNSGCILPAPGFLEGARDLARSHGALLIFDEIITGFRIALGGAQGFYGVHPDLATFGKALGGGLPLSAVAGREDLLSLMHGGGVSFGGTFNGNPISLAAARAALSELAANDGAAVAHANWVGRLLMEGISSVAERHGVPLLACGFGAAFAVHFTRRQQLREYRDTLEDDRQCQARFIREALAEGIYLLPDGRFYVSAAHTEQDAARTLEAIDRVLERMAGTSA